MSTAIGRRLRSLPSALRERLKLKAVGFDKARSNGSRVAQVSLVPRGLRAARGLRTARFVKGEMKKALGARCERS